jgi:hypothetical protein
MEITQIARKAKMFDNASDSCIRANMSHRDFWRDHLIVKRKIVKDNALAIRRAAEAYCGTDHLPLGTPEDDNHCPMALALGRPIGVTFGFEPDEIVLFALAFDEGCYPDLVHPDYYRSESEIALEMEDN